MNEAERVMRTKIRELEKSLVEQGGIIATLFSKYKAVLSPEDRESIESHRRGLNWKIQTAAEGVTTEMLGTLVMARGHLNDTWCHDGCSHPACEAARRSFLIIDGFLESHGFIEGIR